MEFKQGWTYAYSEELKQWLALHNKSGWMYCEDGVKYSPRELAILHTTYGDKPIPWQVHTMKKVFGGEIREDKGAGVTVQDARQVQQSAQSQGNNNTNEFDIF